MSRFLYASLVVLSLFQIPLSANDDPVDRKVESNSLYDPREQSPVRESYRMGVLVGAGVVAGVVIGGVFISLKSHHHQGSQSARYWMIHEEEAGDLPDRLSENLDLGGSGDWVADDFPLRGRRDLNRFELIDDDQPVLVEGSVLGFNIHLASPEAVEMVMPYLQQPDGSVLEGTPQLVDKHGSFSQMLVQQPKQGTYQMGFKSNLRQDQLRMRIEAFNEKNQLVELDEHIPFVEFKCCD